MLAQFERPLPRVGEYDTLLSPGGRPMSATPLALHEATIKQHCKQLHLPTVAGQCRPLAEQAEREHHSHLGYLDALLAGRSWRSASGTPSPGD